MPKGLQRKDPSQSDHRMIAYVLRTFFKKSRIQPIPGEFDLVSKVFSRAGGSWENLFKGSVADINLLKKVVKVAIAEGRMTKLPKFR